MGFEYTTIDSNLTYVMFAFHLYLTAFINNHSIHPMRYEYSMEIQCVLASTPSFVSKHCSGKPAILLKFVYTSIYNIQKRVSSERCAELTIIAASHGLKEAWISYQVCIPTHFVQALPALPFNTRPLLFLLIPYV